MRYKIIQLVATYSGGLFALCDDGTVWENRAVSQWAGGPGPKPTQWIEVNTSDFAHGAIPAPKGGKA